MPVPLDWSKRLAEFVNKWKASGGRSDEYLGDGPFDEFVLTERAASWNAFLGWVSELAGPWSFRGQREAAWFLHTSLDRVVLRSNCPANNSGYYHLSRDVVERDLLFRFQQQAHLYIRHTPAADDLGSWFALMQHHGAPTRLLDWTLTPYVALYFALEEKPETGSSCAVWAIDLDWLERKGRELVALQTSAEGDYTTRSEQLNRLLGHKEEDRSVPTPLIVRIDPRQTDERMAAQQGVFLCSLVRKATFNQILMTMMIHPETVDHPVIRKLEIDTTRRVELLRALRSMNIHRSALFPGLDGFAKSLWLDAELWED